MSGLTVWREPVLDAWIDYNDHLSEAYYVLAFGHATDAVLDMVGLGPDYRAAERASVYTVESHIRFLDQVPARAELEIRSDVIGTKAKLMWIWHEMYVEGRLRATEEILGVHVVDERSAAFPVAVLTRLEAVCVPPPAEAGRSISVR